MKKLLAAFLLIFSALSLFSQNLSLYFPPKVGNTWQTLAPASLGFCPDRVDSLYKFLETRNTKGFILLKDGRIVLEKYFGTFVQDSVWYWASAGKTASAFLVGQAKDDGILSLDDPTSKHLGTGWTACPPDKEAAITVRHQISMSTGLNDTLTLPGVPDTDNCLDPQCLTFLADAGTRWAYHNAPYHLVHDVLESASGKTLNQYSNARLFAPTGMKALWVNHILYSTPRTMARFGLLMLAGGIWDGDTLLQDADYLYDMTHSSQNLNRSYGYLTWLNGQPSFMLPSLQFVFPGKLIPNAPNDMYAALGKNDQKIHVVPSKGWVVVRMGEAGGPGGQSVPITFDNQLWKYLNELVCQPVSTDEAAENQAFVQVSPNPSANGWQLQSQVPMDGLELFDAQGRFLRSQTTDGQATFFLENADLPSGLFFLKIRAGEQVAVQRILKN